MIELVLSQPSPLNEERQVVSRHYFRTANDALSFIKKHGLKKEQVSLSEVSYIPSTHIHLGAEHHLLFCEYAGISTIERGRNLEVVDYKNKFFTGSVCWVYTIKGVVVTQVETEASLGFDELMKRFSFLVEEDGLLHQYTFHKWINEQFLKE